MMKNLLSIILIIFLIANVGWGQTVILSENFDNQKSNSYSSGIITINGKDWLVSDAGNFSYANSNMGSYAFTINDDKEGAYITSPELNTCGNVSFKYAFINGDSNNSFVLQKSNDGINYTNIETHVLGASSELNYVDFSYDINDASQIVYIRISSDNQDAHLFIEDFIVKDYSGTYTPDPEPSNHVTDFSAESNRYDVINLSWREATGENLPAGYLIKASANGTPDAPADGTDVTDDSDLSDGEGAVKVGYGDESCSFSGSAENTTYYFKIWPYSNAGDNIDYKTDGTVPDADVNTPEAPELPDIVINEILADPNGDANNDGTENIGDDEFVELFNNEEVSVDFSAWTLSDGIGVKHVFPSGTVVPAKSAVVVFGGGSPTGSFGNAIVQTASSGELSLNNSGDDVVLSNGTYDVVAYTYGGEAGDDQSITRNPDITGDFVKHTTVTPGVFYSPGYKNDGETSLPVTLSSFTATEKNGSVVIEWITESEVNNLGFNLYRSETKTGKFEKIAGLIKGAGNSSTQNRYSYCDEKVIAGHTYYYQLEDVSADGDKKSHEIVSVTLAENTKSEADRFQLEAAYPNPCNPSSNIRFTIPEQAVVNLSIYNLRGELIKTLVTGSKSPGNYEVKWDGTNSNNYSVGNGIYLYQLRSETGYSQTKKIILLK